jgi:hypothetical protein
MVRKFFEQCGQAWAQQQKTKCVMQMKNAASGCHFVTTEYRATNADDFNNPDSHPKHIILES